MNPVEIFFNLSEPRLKILILANVQMEKKIEISRFQQLYIANIKEASQCLWDLCNDGLLQKTVNKQVCYYQLTTCGQEYIAIVKELVLWSKQHENNEVSL